MDVPVRLVPDRVLVVEDVVADAAVGGPPERGDQVLDEGPLEGGAVGSARGSFTTNTGGGPWLRVPVPQPWIPSVSPIWPGYLTMEKLHRKSNRGPLSLALAMKSIMGTVIIGCALAFSELVTKKSGIPPGVGVPGKLSKKKSLAVLSTFCSQLYRLVRFPP